MNALNRQTVIELAAPCKDVCVSVYLSTDRTGRTARQEPIRLKNLLSQAEERFEKNGMRPVAARKMFADLRTRAEEPSFWSEPSDGLALFVRRGECRMVKTPFQVAETVHAGSTPYLRPLLPGISDSAYWLLAFSQNSVRLLHGSQAGLEEVAVAGLPPNMKEALNYDQPQSAAGVCNDRGRQLGKEGAVFHGQGGAADAAKDDLLAWCRTIDRALHAVLHDEQAPLLLACVDELRPIYRQANTYRHLAEEHVPGNPDQKSAAQLHAAAWPLISAGFEAVRQRAIAAARRLSGTDRSLEEVSEVLRKAARGRVSSLLIDERAERWGRFDVDAESVQLCDTGEGEELLNLAAVFVLRNGGEVHAVSHADLPAGAVIAAVLRGAPTPQPV